MGGMFSAAYSAMAFPGVLGHAGGLDYGFLSSSISLFRRGQLFLDGLIF